MTKPHNAAIESSPNLNSGPIYSLYPLFMFPNLNVHRLNSCAGVRTRQLSDSMSKYPSTLILL
jgi:hypothetical protein